MKLRELLRINEARFKLPGHFRGRLDQTVEEHQWANRIDRETRPGGPADPLDLGADLERTMDAVGAGFMVILVSTPATSYKSRATLRAVDDYLDRVGQVYAKRRPWPSRPIE